MLTNFEVMLNAESKEKQERNITPGAVKDVFFDPKSLSVTLIIEGDNALERKNRTFFVLKVNEPVPSLARIQRIGAATSSFGIVYIVYEAG